MALPARKGEIIEGQAISSDAGLPAGYQGAPPPSTASAYGGGGAPGYRFALMFGILVLLAFFWRVWPLGSNCTVGRSRYRSWPTCCQQQ